MKRNLSPGEQAVLDAVRSADAPVTAMELYKRLGDYSQSHITTCLRLLVAINKVRVISQEDSRRNYYEDVQ